MNIIQLYEDFSIDYCTEGNRHCADGWVQIHCPFCEGSQDYHLGFNIDEGWFNCYRCGWKSIPDTLQKLLNLNYAEVRTIIKQYGGKTDTTFTDPVKEIKLKAHKNPSSVMPLQWQHKKYLESRNFDPEKIEHIWNIMGTGPVSMLDEMDYGNRIFIPFIWNGKQVSFDARDITGKHPLKYFACPTEREIVPRKEIVYCRQELLGKTGIIVEGPTDAWRFGTNACAVSGIKFKLKQVRVISKLFKRAFVIFDGGEIQAKQQADKLVNELLGAGTDAKRIDIDGDPGNMEQTEADYLIKQLTH